MFCQQFVVLVAWTENEGTAEGSHVSSFLPLQILRIYSCFNKMLALAFSFISINFIYFNDVFVFIFIFYHRNTYVVKINKTLKCFFR